VRRGLRNSIFDNYRRLTPIFDFVEYGNGREIKLTSEETGDIVKII
jgi:hypothetical protein